jgi:hypothetical protein
MMKFERVRSGLALVGGASLLLRQSFALRHLNNLVCLVVHSWLSNENRNLWKA